MGRGGRPHRVASAAAVRRHSPLVVTHRVPDDVPTGGVYTFVTDGPEGALEQARAAAGDADVAVMGGPDLGQQYLAQGRLDEIGVHVAPSCSGPGPDVR